MLPMPARPEMCGVRGVGTEVDVEFGLLERCWANRGFWL